MKRLSSRSTDTLTLLHKLVGLAWVVAAIGVLVLTVPALSSGRVDWGRVAMFGKVGSTASVVTIVVAFTYHLFTVWGLLGSRWLFAKWGLYLVAVGTSGYAIRATREQVVGTVVLLAAVQLAALAGSMGTGVYLERSRHAGRLPRGLRPDTAPTE
jgi:hypothetical protein